MGRPDGGNAMNERWSYGAETAELLERCRQLADRAKQRRTQFEVIEGDSDPTSGDGKYAGADAFVLFDISDYGKGRTCGACGDSLEAQRSDARFCCDECRVSGWRSSRKGPNAHE